MVTAPPETTEGERLARLEAVVEALVREVGDIKADIRDLRTMMNRLMLIIMFTIVTMWATTIIAILVRT